MKRRTKVIAIVGSCRKNSNTYYFTEILLKELKKRYLHDLEINIVSLEGICINNCIGCYKCANDNKCIFKDGMELIKSELIKSDIVVLATPIYVNNVSAITKACIDRLHMWFKMFVLAGKHGIILTTSSHLGGERIVHEYLKSVYCGLGIVSLGEFNICIDYPNELYVQDILDTKLELYLSEIYTNYERNYLKSTQLHEFYFTNIKKQVECVSDIENYIYNAWVSSGMLKSDSFQGYLEKFR